MISGTQSRSENKKATGCRTTAGYLFGLCRASPCFKAAEKSVEILDKKGQVLANADVKYIQKVSSEFYAISAQTLLDNSSLSVDDKYNLISDLGKVLKA